MRDILGGNHRLVLRIAMTTSFLAFDESGSLLVAASAEGQTVDVILLPSGVPLYKLERGLRPAKIVNVCFSPDRRWIAVSSNHGTTHMFPVHPTGVRATASTHVKRNGAESGYASQAAVLNSSQPRYMNDFGETRIHISGSSAKISTPTDSAIRSVQFTDSNTVRIVRGDGAIDDFALTVSVLKSTDRDEPDQLSAEVKSLRRFDLSRPANETPLPAVGASDSASLPTTPTSTPKPSKSDVFLDHPAIAFELHACPDPLVPIWASPQFTLIECSGPSDQRNDLESIFYTPEGTMLQVGRAAPPPPGLSDAIRTPAFDDA